MNKIGLVTASVLVGVSMLGTGGVTTQAKSLAETQPAVKSTPVKKSANADVATEQNRKPQEFWIVTNEIKSPPKDGVAEIEVYRWDPGFLVVSKGQPVTLHFYGVKGKEHPFVIEGLGVKGDLKKGQVTTVTFTPEKTGTFKIVCLVHQTLEQHGPMIGYLRVE